MHGGTLGESVAGALRSTRDGCESKNPGKRVKLAPIWNSTPVAEIDLTTETDSDGAAQAAIRSPLTVVSLEVIGNMRSAGLLGLLLLLEVPNEVQFTERRMPTVGSTR